MSDLKITLVQTHLHWQDPTANRSMIEEKLWNIGEDTDLIILPEMFTTGFTMETSKLAEPMNLHTFKWMKQVAQQHKAVVTGSFIAKEGGNYFNRLIWMQPDGDYDFYDKRHLFRMAKEDQSFKGGSKKMIKNLKGWNVCPLICYDLRFPIWSRNINLEYDLLVYVANWPQVRSQAWKTLLQARAIENISYVAGVNRIGKDGNDIYYSGDSAIINFKGDKICEVSEENKIFTTTLSRKDLSDFREKFPAHLDADNFKILD